MTRRRMRGRASTAVPMVLIAGVALGCAAPTEDTTPRAPAAAAASAPAVSGAVGPSGERYGVPIGWSRDRAGAEAAAVAYVETSALVATAGPLQRRDLVLTLATEDYGPRLVEQTDRQLDDLLFSLGQRGVSRTDLIWREYALAARTDSFTDDRAVVRVWSVVVIGVRDTGVPRQLWRTSTLELRWEGDWRVADWSTEAGPLPAPPAEADVASAGELEEVTGWSDPSAVGAP